MEAYFTYREILIWGFENDFHFNTCVKIEIEILPEIGSCVNLSSATIEKLRLAYLSDFESWNKYKSKGAITARCNEHNKSNLKICAESKYYSEPYLFRNKKTNKVDCYIMPNYCNRRKMVEKIKYFEHDCKVYPVIKLVDSWKFE